MYTVEFHENTLKQCNEYMYIGLDIDIQCLSIDENRCCSVTPILTKDKYSRELPQILLNGKSRHKAYKQMMKNIPEHTLRNEYNIYKAFEAKSNSRLHCTYFISVAYEHWMKNAGITIV